MEPLTQAVWRWSAPLCCLLGLGSILVGGCVFRSMPSTDSNARQPPHSDGTGPLIPTEIKPLS